MISKLRLVRWLLQNVATNTMKVQLAQILTMFTACTLCASAPASIILDRSDVYQSLSKRIDDGPSMVRNENVLISKFGSVGNRRRRSDIQHNRIELDDRRRLHDGSGKGNGKGGTSNKLDICLNRQYKSVATASDRSLHSATGYENGSYSKGKSGSMGTRRKDRRCASKKRGKGGSSKSKYSKGKASNICSDYDFSKRRQLEHDKTESSNEIKTILDVARGIPRLSIFVDLVERTSLPAILECNGPFTVLIPANRAFRTLDPEIFADLLLRDKSGKLEDILLSHIVPGRILSYEFHAGYLKALNGDTIKVSINPLTFHQNVTTGTGDIIATNGIIHIIDSVLFTNGTTAT
jgi:uncharacterized surface protein with fasciclin (FAS1) repeats